MPRRLARASFALATPLAAGLLFTGCGSDAPAVSDPTPPASSQGSQPAPQTTSESPSAPDTSSEAPSTTEAPPSTSTSPDSSSDSQTLAGKSQTFEVTMPEGWQDVLSRLDGYKYKAVQLAMADSVRSDGVLTNINVVETNAPGIDSETIAKKSADTYRDRGETVELLPERTIAGEQANGYTKEDTEGRRSQTQWFFAHDDKVYSVTLTTAPSHKETAAQTLDQVMESWAWT